MTSVKSQMALSKKTLPSTKSYLRNRRKTPTTPKTQMLGDLGRITVIEIPFVGAGVEDGATEAEVEVETLPPTPNPIPTPPPPTPEETPLLPNNELAMAGNLPRYFEIWTSFTNDKFVLKVVQSGYKIQILTSNINLKPIISNPSLPNRSALQKEIDSLLAIKAIAKIDPSPNDIVSRIFIVPKKNGKSRK